MVLGASGATSSPDSRHGAWRRYAFGTAWGAMLLFVSNADGALRHAWISLTWPQSEAVVLAVPAPGPWRDGWRGPKGYPYAATVSAQASDGQPFTVLLIEPLFSSFSGSTPVPSNAARPPPRVGDRIVVHLHPSGDGRAMPRDNLRRLGGTVLFLSIFGGLTIFSLVRLVQALRR